MFLAEAWEFGPTQEPGVPQLRGARRAAFAASIVVLCVLAAGVLLGLRSLLLGWTQGGMEMMHRVHYVAWGTFSVILVCGAAAPQAWKPERRPAAMQQLLACVAAGGIAMAASRAFAPSHVLRGAAFAVPVGVMFVLHPARKQVLRLGRMSPLLASLTVVAAVPLVSFALGQIRIQRVDTVSPHGVAFHWGTMATLAFAIVATLLVAAIGAPGWRLSAWCGGLALATFGLSSIVNPGYASSVGRVWAIGAVTLALVFIGAAERRLLVQRRAATPGPPAAETEDRKAWAA